jgi:diguanylate cyclase (GGDEF)-like protein/PAS domain S-box-containing protein
MAKYNGIPLVLVVDDDELIRQLVRENLEREGFSVAEAANGAQGLQLFAECAPDIVLLDIIMPGMNGYEVCKAIRSLPKGKHTPILMATGLDDVESIDRCYGAGATNFITKPISWAALNHHIKYMLRNSALYADLCRSEARLALAQKIARLGTWEWDMVNNTISWSDGAYDLLGVPHTTLSYDDFLELIYPDDREVILTVLNDFITHGGLYTFEHRIVHANGGLRYLCQQGEVLVDDAGKAISLSGTIQDVTERRLAEEKIAALAFHDALTNLPNRYLLRDRLGQAIKQAQRNERLVAVMFLDLDRFKRINDTLGHSVGDQLLQEIGSRLSESVRTVDTVAHLAVDGGTITVARMGGDEFAVLVTELRRVQDVVKIARRIQETVSRPYWYGAHQLFATLSIGISLYPYDGQEVDVLLKNADSALHFAKSQGRNNWQFYTESMNAKALERLILESNLLRGLEQKEFVLYYQPLLDLETGRITGMEALARWQHPEQGLIYPNHFIPLAEETGLIVPFVDWTLRTACLANRKFEREGVKPVRLAVNLPSRQFMQKDLKQNIMRILDETGHSPELLELEITEGTIMQNEERSIGMLRQLKDLGITISIDDFGTGYSSLSYLKQFPLDTLKIDRAFLKDLPDDQDNASITMAIIAMAKSLRLRVIAEGVETYRQLEFLKNNGCDEMQGFLFSPAVPANDFLNMLRTGRSLDDLFEKSKY